MSFNKSKIQLACVTSAVLLLCGCVKTQILPDGMVEDTISTTKDMIDDVRMKRSGAEKRTFRHEVPLLIDQDEAETIQACINYLEARASQTSKKPIKITDEKTSRISNPTQDSILCELEVYIWPKK